MIDDSFDKLMKKLLKASEDLAEIKRYVRAVLWLTIAIDAVGAMAFVFS